MLPSLVLGGKQTVTRFVRPVVVAVICAAWLAVAAPADAVATSGARIVAIYFDSPGADRGGNTSLNAEWVKIKNVTRSRKTITGWTLHDRANHVFHFPSLTLGAGATVRVHTGSGMRGGGNLYWGSGWYIWNNTGDTATLRNANGTRVDTCTYSANADPEAFC
jgi:hypothetical protein